MAQQSRFLRSATTVGRSRATGHRHPAGRHRLRHLLRFTAVTAVSLLALGALPGAAARAGQAAVLAPVPAVGPGGDAFFTPPSPLPAGRPGDVIRYRRAVPTSPLGESSLAGVDAWQILYLSTDGQGRPDAVSGMVLLPKSRDPRRMPVVGVAPGTHGIGDTCAPSAGILAGLDYAMLDVDGILNRGWAVALTDYQGLGTPGTHTYMVGRPQGNALLDAVRAARRLPADGLSPDAPVALYGYSQGGGAAGWAAQLQPTYAPELPLRGVAAGGTPADLAAVAKNLDGGLGFAFLGMAAIGLDAAYPELRLDDYLTPAGRSAMSSAATMCVIEALPSFAFKRIADYTTTDPLATPAWRARVDSQRLGRIRPQVPVFLGHGLVDQFIPYRQAVRLRQDWCAAGVRVTWHDYVGEHLSTMVEMQDDALNFLGDRFAGRRATSTC